MKVLNLYLYVIIVVFLGWKAYVKTETTQVTVVEANHLIYACFLEVTERNPTVSGNLIMDMCLDKFDDKFTVSDVDLPLNEEVVIPETVMNTPTTPKNEFINVATPIVKALDGDLELVTKIVKVESSFRAGVTAETSSAGGYFQFIDRTWESMISKYGNVVNVEKGTSKYDPIANIKMGVMLIKENERTLTEALGRPPNHGELYLAHFLGVGVATKVIKADPNTPVDNVASYWQIYANRSIMKDKTVDELKAWAERKMN